MNKGTKRRDRRHLKRKVKDVTMNIDDDNYDTSSDEKPNQTNNLNIKNSKNSKQELDLETETSKDMSFLNLCDMMENDLIRNYREQRNKIRMLKKKYIKELKAAMKFSSKRRRKNTETGFTKPETVPDELANLIGVDKGTVMARTKLTKCVYDVFRKRGLQYKGDKRVLRADNEIKKIFNLPDSVNNSTKAKDDTGINFYNIQKYIAKCYNNYNKNNVNKKRLD